jgi:hypothetical protein
MKEVSVEIAYSEEVLSILNEYMDDLGQIKVEGCEDAVIEVMPVDKKNFIAGAPVVITIILEFGSQLALSLLTQWICDKITAKKSIVTKDSKISVETKEELIKLLSQL